MDKAENGTCYQNYLDSMEAYSSGTGVGMIYGRDPNKAWNVNADVFKWIPGGKTDGGVPEAITDLIPNIAEKCYNYRNRIRR